MKDKEYSLKKIDQIIEHIMLIDVTTLSRSNFEDGVISVNNAIESLEELRQNFKNS